MYKLFIRPILFCFDPEKVHYLTLWLLQFICKFPFTSSIIKAFYNIESNKLQQEIFGINFKNPVGLAAGFDKNGKYIKELANLGFGFIEIGTVTPLPQNGNPKKRLFRLSNDQAIINRMGINNDGSEICAERLQKMKSNIIIGGNIGKNTTTENEKAADDYISNFKILHPYVDYFVLNVSCPNVSNFSKLQDVEFLRNLIPELKAYNLQQDNSKPILIKISPDLNNEQLDETINLITKEKIDGIIATNTTTKRDNLLADYSTLNKIGSGGLSGLPLKKRSTEIIKYIAKKTNNKTPIIGVGGIMTAEDAIEKINAGASLVQIYTGFIYNGPSLIKKINKKILQQQNES